MKFGLLSDHFTGIAWKRLTSVEVDPKTSHGHEFNSPAKLRDLLGTNPRKAKEGNGLRCKCIYFGSDDSSFEKDDCVLSWYDSRAEDPKRSAEWRLYYTDNTVIGKEGRAVPGDFVVIALDKSESELTIIVAAAGSTAESQLEWLFGIRATVEEGFEIAAIDHNQAVDGTRANILEALGYQVSVQDDNLLESIVRKFPNGFPMAMTFSEFVRGLCKSDATKEPDAALMDWMDFEEFAFRLFEKHLAKAQIERGFKDVDEFMSCALSMHQRRKSRAGLAFENHLREIFRVRGIANSWQATLENNATPDFLFPSVSHYLDSNFEDELLTMLGAKRTCKDRWTQVLPEAPRIKQKHVVTVEPALSADQLKKMREHEVQLVVPLAIQSTYSATERDWLWSLARFLETVETKQTQGGIPRCYTLPQKASAKRKKSPK